MTHLGDMNLSLVLGAIGSALGCGVAGMSAVGAWKKAYLQNKVAPFLLVAFVGAPLTQTIYCFILRNQILSANWEGISPGWPILIGGVVGFAIGLSALMQGKVSAKACDALAESGKGFANYIMAIGIVETVAVFTLIFAMIALP
jgi:V/A-type H+-transporting ATPase subunit K